MDESVRRKEFSCLDGRGHTTRGPMSSRSSESTRGGGGHIVDL